MQSKTLFNGRMYIMRVKNYHKHDNMSVLELDTPLEIYKEIYGQEAYELAKQFYQSEEWEKFEKEQLNSDRRYYDHKYDNFLMFTYNYGVFLALIEKPLGR